MYRQSTFFTQQWVLPFSLSTITATLGEILSLGPMQRVITSILFFLVFGCSDPQGPTPPFIEVIIIDQPGLTAPIPDTIRFTTSAIVNGNSISKDFEFEAQDHILPTDFVVLFSEGVRGNTVDISIHAFLDGAEIFTATTSGIAGSDSVSALARFCGDGTTDTDRTEACDDGELNTDTEPNGCRTSCQAAGCGDEVLDADEACDEGALNSDTQPNACRASCVLASCGDGVIDNTEACDDGAQNSDTNANACRTSCTVAFCGDGVTDTGEECDDANGTDNDGCDNDCRLTKVIQIATGGSHTCALLRSGSVRCWGENDSGQLGYGNTENIGDDEFPLDAGDVNVGGRVTQLTLGSDHTCALLDTGKVRCWGQGDGGQLGYGNTTTIGDNETPASAGDVNVGGTVIQIDAGEFHTCALLNTGKVRCWGALLSYGNSETIGDNETPNAAGDISLNGNATQISAGGSHACAILSPGFVRCWGSNLLGELGQGNTNTIGDNETPAGLSAVVSDSISIKIGSFHTCSLGNDANINCWGDGTLGQLGLGNTTIVGDNEGIGDIINVFATVESIDLGDFHSCAVSNTGELRCWGDNVSGQLGYGNTNNIGDNELPSAAGPVDVGGIVTQISAASSHTCALLNTGTVRCWGFGLFGRLGYGNQITIGDNETPASAGDVPVF
jgi:cysteine-rich repeat protein